MIYVNGFCKFFEKECVGKNVLGSFLQLSELFDKRKSFNESDTLAFILAFSWSYLLYCSGNDIYLCGFFYGKSGQVVRLHIPDESKVIQVCCSNNHCHFLTEIGNYWLYVIDTCKWRNVNHLLHVGPQNEDSSLLQKEDKLLSVSKHPQFIYKISCGDHLTIAAANSGLYSVPLLLSFPQVQVLDVSCGKEHAVLLTELGTVFTWGNGSRGQLGHGELETEEQPRELHALSGLKVIAIAAGGWHSCCITEQGDLYTWGWNCSGQLGFPGEDKVTCEDEGKGDCVVSVLAEPRPVDWPNEELFVKLVSCGSQHTVAVLGDNSVWGCGWNKYGQLMGKPLPEKVFGMTKICIPADLSNNITHIVCGSWTTAFISSVKK